MKNETGKHYPTIGKTAKSKQQRTAPRWIAHLFLLLAAVCFLPSVALAQGQARIPVVVVVPATCSVSGTNSPVMVWKRSGANPGLYTCVAGVFAYQTNTFGASLTQKTMLYASATPATVTSTAAPTNGQLLIGSTGNIPALGTLTGTANETLITNASASITIGLAAAVIHQGGANFILTDTADTTKRFQFVASGITAGATRSLTIPDANITLARTDAAQTFTGNQTFGGTLLGSAGTGALPTFSFSGDPNTGMFSSGADAIGFATNGVERWVINSSGSFVPLVNNTYDIGNGTVNPRDVNIARNLVLSGSTSGTTTVKAAAIAGTTTLTLPAGTTDFSATGGAGQVVKQSSSGAALTVAALLSTDVQTIAETKLSTTAAVDMNTATPTVLYTCPAALTCVITKVTVRNASTSLTTASYSFGWVSATFLDVIANATHTELTGATLYTILPAKVGSRVGAATETFNVLMNTLQGGAATTTIDVFGYVF